MRENVEELLVILDYYRFLANYDFFTLDMQDKIDLLDKDIKELNLLFRSDGDFSSFNFESLKNTLNALFSPSVFSPPTEFLQNPEDSLFDTLDIVDMISFQVSKDSTFSVSPDGEIEELRKPRHLKKKEKYDLGEKLLDATSIALYLVSERFNYIFKGVPSNTKEYFHLLDKYEKVIKNLSSKVAFLDSAISVLGRQLLLLKTERLNITRDEYVEQIYNERLEKAQNEAANHSDALNSFEQQRVQREAELEPVISQSFFNWQSERQFYIQQYESLYNAYMYQSQTMQDQNFVESRKRLEEMAKYINENYADMNLGYTRIREAVLANDVNYQQITKNLTAARDNFRTSNSKLAQLTVNMSVILERIRQELEEDYSKKIDDVSKQLESKKKLRKKKKDKLDKYQQKKDELIENHQKRFDIDRYYKRQKQ